jgi:thermostable 8-oxoguanine DNA glycosylase
MITPTSITNYNRTEAELEEFLLFSIMVAGKNSQQTAKKLDSFLFATMGLISPLDWIANLVKIKENKISSTDPLMVCMKNHKLGQYNRLFSAFTGILQFKGRLSSVTVQELESVKGIGPKTARFFLLHSRPNQEIAVLDTHILHWMRDNGIQAPKTTPSGEKYLKFEKMFIDIAKKNDISIADLDLRIWTAYSSKKKTLA